MTLADARDELRELVYIAMEELRSFELLQKVVRYVKYDGVSYERMLRRRDAQELAYKLLTFYASPYGHGLLHVPPAVAQTRCWCGHDANQHAARVLPHGRHNLHFGPCLVSGCKCKELEEP